MFAGCALADHDNHTNFVQTCAENGFASESYTVISEDGYVYQIYRIPGKAGDTSTKKPAVLLMHGIECDSNFWTPNTPENVPAFMLAEQGYDVWLGNNRGTRYGQYHTTMDKSQQEFWRFSQEEMGLKDLPTFIDHILATTGQEKLTYIGHSQGTTQMFLAASLNPEYFNSKVNLFVALGPVTSLVNIEVPALRALSKEWREVEYLGIKFGAYDLFNLGYLEETAVQLLCNEVSFVCDDLVRYVADANTDVDDMDRYDVFLKDFPAGNGYGNLVYYAQSIQNTEDWLRYDYGIIKNMEVYATAVPPAVPIDQLSLPTGLFIGSYDKLATVADNEWLVS